MKEKSSNYSKKYEPEVIEGTNISINFNVNNSDESKNINATLLVGEKNHGHLGYSSKEGYIVCQLKPVEETITKNISKIFSRFGECLAEILTK